jgi:hypothetical protein
MLCLLSLSLLSLPSQARAIEPISIVATLLGAVISPVVCKEIGCTKDVIINMDRSRMNKRLIEMRDNFKWDNDINNITTSKKEVSSKQSKGK